MDVFLSVVPTDDADAEFVRKAELPTLPETGQHITISVGESGLEHYVVRRFHSWSIDYPELSEVDDDSRGTLNSATVEVKPVRGPALTDHHENLCDRYDISQSFERPFL